MKYPITTLKIRDEFEAFSRLCQRIYPKSKPNPSLYSWLFSDNVYNGTEGHLLHVAKDGDKVVAADCLMPVPIIIKGRDYSCAWSIKTMTDPDYQRQGIFSALTRHNIAEARKRGIDLILGFANANSFPGYVKFGWEVLFERKAYICPLDYEQSSKLKFEALGKLANKLYRRWNAAKLKDRRGTVIESASAPAEIDQVWGKIHPSYNIMVRRDHKYCQWRYNQRPQHQYRFLLHKHMLNDEPDALLIWRKVKNKFAIIVDYIGPPEPEMISRLVNQALHQSSNEGMQHMLVSSSDNFHDLLAENNGFRPVRKPLENNMFIGLLLNDKLNPEDLKTSENWYYTYGDSEFDLDAGF